MSDKIVKRCFCGLVSRIGGACFIDFQKGQEKISNRAWKSAYKPLPKGGLFKYIHGGEYHMYNPEVVQALQAAVRKGSFDDYRVYYGFVINRPVSCLSQKETLATVQ